MQTTTQAQADERTARADADFNAAKKAADDRIAKASAEFRHAKARLQDGLEAAKAALDHYWNHEGHVKSALESHWFLLDVERERFDVAMADHRQAMKTARQAHDAATNAMVRARAAWRRSQR